MMLTTSPAPKPLRNDRRARWRGALAGLIPMLVIAGLFAIGPTSAQPAEVAVSLGLVALITTSAGWLAGPLSAAEPRRLLVAAFGYAIALIITNALLAIIKAAADSVGAHGLDPLALVEAILGLAAYALVATAYLILPAIIAGILWSLAARGLLHLDGQRP